MECWSAARRGVSRSSNGPPATKIQDHAIPVEVHGEGFTFVLARRPRISGIERIEDEDDDEDDWG
jgi:hypothetical protein